ncbi:MAG: hypothetical protein U0271_30190 [Polyangiaceae bacterium]
MSTLDIPASVADDEAKRLARTIQKGFPLERDPWSTLARDTGSARDAVLETMRRWSRGGELREVSAVFEGEALGYESALVAASVATDDLERVARVVCAHPTVTHCYERSYARAGAAGAPPNLWFTIAVPPRMGLAATLHLLEGEAGQSNGAFIPLRRGRTFKIGVSFDLETRANDTGTAAAHPISTFTPTSSEISMIRALQAPLSLEDDPFAALATRAGVTPTELLDFAHRALGGPMRRYVATFRHRKLGVRGNGMVVWRIADNDLERVGLTLAGAREVSHCYSRPPFKGFPYSLYSMIHGPDEAAVVEIAERLARELAVTMGAEPEFEILFSTREHKKTRLRYYLPELDAWWGARAGGDA